MKLASATITSLVRTHKVMEVMPREGTLLRNVSVKIAGRAYGGLVLGEKVGKVNCRCCQAAKIFTR